MTNLSSSDEATPAAPDRRQPVIEVTDLVKAFGGRKVLNGVSFKVYAGRR